MNIDEYKNYVTNKYKLTIEEFSDSDPHAYKFIFKASNPIQPCDLAKWRIESIDFADRTFDVFVPKSEFEED